MGRHTAADGSPVHPLVAEGLARRSSGTAGEHRGTAEGGARAAEVGWPASPNKGQGLGWPGDLPAEGREEPAAEPAPRSRRSWRRVFGAPAA